MVPAKSLVEFQSQVFALIQTRDGLATAAKAVVVEIVDVVAPDAVIQDLTRNHQSFIDAMTSSMATFVVYTKRHHVPEKFSQRWLSAQWGLL